MEVCQFISVIYLCPPLVTIHITTRAKMHSVSQHLWFICGLNNYETCAVGSSVIQLINVDVLLCLVLLGGCHARRIDPKKLWIYVKCSMWL